MDKKEKNRVISMFIDIAKDAAEFFAKPESAAFANSLILSSYEAEREDILVCLLRDPLYAQKFSEKYLEELLSKKVREIIRSLREKESGKVNAKGRKAADDVFNEIDSFTTEQIVYLPVSGIKLQLEGEILEIGNITLQKMTEERIQEAVNYLLAGLMATKNTSDEKEGHIKILKPKLEKQFKDAKDTIYAICRFEAEPIRAKERAIEECYQVFDLLRYALPYMYPLTYPMKFSIPAQYIKNDAVQKKETQKRQKTIDRQESQFISFGLQGEVGANTHRHMISFSTAPGFSWEENYKERFLPLQLNQESIADMTEIGVFEIAKTLKEEKKLTSFKQTILRSIHWFADAQLPMQPEYILLSLVSSIEAFLNPPNHQQVTEAIVEGVAAILGDERAYKYTKKRMEELYDIRSKLSHGDKVKILEKDIIELKQIAFLIIHQMIQRRDEFKDQKQLFKKIKEMREKIEQTP